MSFYKTITLSMSQIANGKELIIQPKTTLINYKNNPVFFMKIYSYFSEDITAKKKPNMNLFAISCKCQIYKKCNGSTTSKFKVIIRKEGTVILHPSFNLPCTSLAVFMIQSKCSK